MALARIFSRFPEQTTALSQELQQQGYKVEVLSPDQAPATLADLEIQLEVCDPADVLRRAAELAARLQCDIAVAPGALQPDPSPEQITAALPQPEEPAPPALVPESQAPSAEPAALAAPTMETHQPAQEPGQKEAKDANATRAASGSFLPQAARSLGAALAACTAAANQLLASARDQFRESGELARIRLAHARALREQHLLDLTRRRAESQQHLLELKAGRKVLDAYLQLQRACPEGISETQAPVRSASAQEAAPIGESSASGWKLKTWPIPLRTRQVLLACLASAVALFVIGLTVSAFHSRQVPSNAHGDTVQSGGVTLQAPPPKPATPPRPSPAVRKAMPKPAIQVHKTQVHKTQAHKTQPKVPQPNEDLIASDVVVRHSPPPKPTPSTQANGWKHFSDMHN
ncbi:MAG TPA: hypothetical protein VI488_21910 [Candidatus Angelobacter sp.]